MFTWVHLPVATQFLSRGIPFIFNSWIVRHLTEEDYAVTFLSYNCSHMYSNNCYLSFSYYINLWEFTYWELNSSLMYWYSLKIWCFSWYGREHFLTPPNWKCMIGKKNGRIDCNVWKEKFIGTLHPKACIVCFCWFCFLILELDCFGGLLLLNCCSWTWIFWAWKF